MTPMKQTLKQALNYAPKTTGVDGDEREKEGGGGGGGRGGAMAEINPGLKLERKAQPALRQTFRARF